MKPNIPYGKDNPEYTRRLRALCLFVAKDMRPLHVVEGEGFRGFVKQLDARFTLLTRPELTVALYAAYNAKKA